MFSAQKPSKDRCAPTVRHPAISVAFLDAEGYAGSPFGPEVGGERCSAKGYGIRGSVAEAGLVGTRSTLGLQGRAFMDLNLSAGAGLEADASLTSTFQVSLTRAVLPYRDAGDHVLPGGRLPDIGLGVVARWVAS